MLDLGEQHLVRVSLLLKVTPTQPCEVRIWG
jgi:hypothetical protein